MLKELRERRAKLISDARQVVEGFTARGEALSAEALERVDKLRAEAKSIGETLDRAEEIETEDRAYVPDTQRVRESRETEPAGVEQRNAAVTAMLRGQVTPEQRQILAAMQSPELRDQSTTGSGGGYTIAPDTSFYGRILEAMKAYGGMMAAPVTVLNTATGADLPIATDDDTANVGLLVAEAGSHASGTDITFGQTTLKAYVISSKIVKVSQQLIQDSAANFEAFLGRALGTRVARKINAYLTVGTGSSQPQGIAYSGASIGRTCASGYTTTCTADDLIRLKHSVDPAYRNANTRWMFNDATLLGISLLKDGDGQYIWKAGLAEGTPDRSGSPS